MRPSILKWIMAFVPFVVAFAPLSYMFLSMATGFTLPGAGMATKEQLSYASGWAAAVAGIERAWKQVKEDRKSQQQVTEITNKAVEISKELHNIIKEVIEDPGQQEKSYEKILSRYITGVFSSTEIRAGFYLMDSGENEDNPEDTKNRYLELKAEHCIRESMSHHIGLNSENNKEIEQARSMIKRIRENKSFVVPNVHKSYRSIGWEADKSITKYKSFASYPVERKMPTKKPGKFKSGGLLILDSKEKNFFNEKNEKNVRHCAEILTTLLNIDQYNTNQMRSSGQGKDPLPTSKKRGV